MNVGEEMYNLCCGLFPICRSLTGDGVRQTLLYFKEILPDIIIHEVPSGTPAFDWIVPEEWAIRDAFIKNEAGLRTVDFNKNNLHVVGYSEPIDRIMSFVELDAHLYSLPDQPEAIPYITSYYKRRWGFCLSENQRNEMRRTPNAKYHVKIDSALKSGSLTYGELILPGESGKEVLLSTYVCHPSMANNELSGPVVSVGLAKWLLTQKCRRHTYRILFIPETIGSIVYLSRHLEHMQKNTIAGFVLTCLGDDRTYSYLPSRQGDALADRVAQHVLKYHAPDYKRYSFLDRGSDERQYCSPGVDLPVCSIMRSKYGEYPEYHTSLDNMNLISPEGLRGGYEVVRKCSELLEANYVYKTKVNCEPQLGKRGLYPTISTKDTAVQVRSMMNFIAYADGTRDLLAIADLIKENAFDLVPIAQTLFDASLLDRQ